MKVLHVIPSLSAVDGGPTTAVLSMERVLREQGIDVEVATTDDAGPGLRNGRPPGVALQEDGGVHRYFRKSTEFYKASPSLGRWLRRTAREYDLLHLHALFSYSTAAAARAARACGVPYVVRPLGTLDAYGMRARRPALKRLSLRWIEAPLLEAAAAVHFTSDAEAAHARSLGLSLRGVVIPLGVPCSAAPPQHAAHAVGPRLLSMSRLDPKKNVECLIDAAAQLLARWPGLELAIAGEGAPSYAQALKDRVQQAGLASHARWLGHIDGAAKAAALAAADIFVLPSYSENFGIAAAEALAAGLPCVLGEGVAIAADVERAGAGFAVAPTAQAVAAGVSRIMSSPGGRDAMGARAWSLARDNFSTQVMGERLKQLYSAILDGTHGLRGH